MAIKVYKGGSWVNTTSSSLIGKADTLSIGQTNTSLATSDKKYYISFVDENHPYNDRKHEDFYTGIGLTYSPISRSLGVGGVLYLSGTANNFQGSIRSYGGADKLFVLYNQSSEGVIDINPANSAGVNGVGIATFKRSTGDGDKSYFRSDVSPTIDCNGIYDLGKADKKWNKVYANCFIGDGGGMSGTGNWDMDTYGNLKAGTEAGHCITAETCFNIFAGYRAGCLTTGASGLGGSDQIADGNVFLGTYAGRCNATGAKNFYGGYFAGRGKQDEVSSGHNNIFIGQAAGMEIGSGQRNVFLGFYSGTKIDSGNDNVFLGSSAGRNVTSASQSIAIGIGAGFCNTTGNNNSFLGTYAGHGVTSGGDNVAIGANAFRGQDGIDIIGIQNVAIGYAAGRCIGPLAVDQGGNTFLGAQAACCQLGGSFNVAIGYQVQLEHKTCGNVNCISNQLAIGAGSNRWLTGDKSFNIKPGRGIIDCTGSSGGSSQVLTAIQDSGASYVKWETNSSVATNADKVGIGTTDNANGATIQDYYVPFVRDNNPHDSRQYEDLYSDSKLVYRYNVTEDTGAVGINTDVVGQELNVYSKVFSAVRVKSARIASAPMDTMTQIGGLQFSDSDHSIFDNGKTMSAVVGTVRGDLILKTGHDAVDNGSLDRVTITPVGHVGIGTTNPITDDPHNGKTIKDYLENNNKVLAVGIVTAHEYYGTFKGDIDNIATNKIQQDTTYAEVVDDGDTGNPTGHFKVITEGTERLRIDHVGKSVFSSPQAQIAQFARTGVDNGLWAKVDIKTNRANTISGNESYLTFSNATSDETAAFLYDHKNNSMAFEMYSGSSGGGPGGQDKVERLRIGPVGQLRFGTDSDYGESGQVLTSGGADNKPYWNDAADITSGVTKVAILKDQKNFDIKGGNFTEGAWRDRDLTVKEDPQGFVTFEPTPNGQTTFSGGTDGNGDPLPGGDRPGIWSLPAGKYKIDWEAPGQDVNRHVSKLVWSTTKSDISTIATAGGTGTNYVMGSVENITKDDTTSATVSSTKSFGSAIVEITETTWFKILHYATHSQTNSGFGQPIYPDANPPIGSGDYTIYTQVRIEDLATAVKDSSTTQVAKQIEVQKHEDWTNDFYFGMISGAGENGSPVPATVYTDTALKYVPSTDTLTSSNVTVTGQLNVTGNTTLGDNGNEDTITFTGKVNSSILPSHNAANNGDASGLDLGGSGAYWRKIYAREFTGSLSGDATSAQTLNIGTDDHAGDRYLTFVAASGDGKDVYMDSELKYNPNTDTLTPVNLNVAGNTTLGAVLNTDTTTFSSKVVSHIIPGGTLTEGVSQYNLGELGAKWGTVFAKEFNGAFTGSIEKINTANSENEDITYLTFTTTTPTDDDRGSYLLVNPHLYFRSNSSSPGEKLTVDCLLDVTGNTTLGNSASSDIVTFNSKIASDILPSHSATDKNDTSGLDLGDGSNYWRKVYAREYAGKFVGTLESRNIAMTGDVHWNVDFDASGDVTNTSTIQENAVDESMINIGNGPSAGYFLQTDASGNLSWAQVSSGSGVNLNFTDLQDTLSSYSGQANRLLVVNSGETGVIFTDASSVGTDNYVNSMSLSGTTLTLGRTGTLTDLTQDLSSITGATSFLDLSDTPNSFSANKVVKVNSAGNALEFAYDNNTNTTYDFVTFGTSNENSGLKLKGSDGSSDGIVITGTNGITVIGNASEGNMLTIGCAEGFTSDKVDIELASDNNTYYPTFVSGTTATGKTIYQDTDGLTYNPSTNLLTTQDLSVTGNTTLGNSITGDTVTWNAKSTTILPTNNSQNLGSQNDPWGTVYANNISGTLTVDTSDTQVLYTKTVGNTKVAGGTDDFVFTTEDDSGTKSVNMLKVSHGSSTDDRGEISAYGANDVNYAAISGDGGVEICRGSNATGEEDGGAYIDFKDSSAGENYDARIQLTKSGLGADWDSDDNYGILFETGGIGKRHMLLTEEGTLGITNSDSGSTAIVKKANRTNGFAPGYSRDTGWQRDGDVALDVDGTALLRRNGATYEGGQITFCNSDDTVAYTIDVYGTTASNSILRIIDEKALTESDTRGTQRFAINRSGALGIGDVGNEDYGSSSEVRVLRGNGDGSPPTWSPLGSIGGVPQGVICMYTGDTAPSGWVICDNSTAAQNAGAPDLRDKFIVGADPNANANDTTYPGVKIGSHGGYTDAVTVAHTHGLNQHTHGLNNHTHGDGNYATTGNAGSHNHGFRATWRAGDEVGWDQANKTFVGDNAGTHEQVTVNTHNRINSGGSHNHNVGGNSGPSNANTTGSNDNTSSASNAIEATNRNLPPWYALCYIMKT